MSPWGTISVASEVMSFDISQVNILAEKMGNCNSWHLVVYVTGITDRYSFYQRDSFSFSLQSQDLTIIQLLLLMH